MSKKTKNKRLQKKVRPHFFLSLFKFQLPSFHNWQNHLIPASSILIKNLDLFFKEDDDDDNPFLRRQFHFHFLAASDTQISRVCFFGQKISFNRHTLRDTVFFLLGKSFKQ
jgi:hypothetical protein